MRENIDISDFELTDEDMTRIAAFDTGATLFFDHQDPEKVDWVNSRRPPCGNRNPIRSLRYTPITRGSSQKSLSRALLSAQMPSGGAAPSSAQRLKEV